MLKWSLILNILFLTTLISSCVTSPGAPKLPHTPEQYIYADEPDKWCRQDDEGALECAEDLRNFILFSVTDVGMIQKYIIDLNEKCEKWRPDEL